MREEIEKILDETPYLDYETPDIDSMADQILTLLEDVIPTEQNYPLKASIDTPEEDARELRYFDGYNQAIADIKDKLK